MAKKIVVCYDGTNAEYGKYNTNIVKVFETIVRDDNQVAFYDPGVGTISIFGRIVGRRIGILLGKMCGYGIQQNWEEGYEYLMNTFQPDDRIYIFGFSRGAYTARSLAGMIHYFGILKKGSENLIPYVSKMYKRMKRKREDEVYAKFKDTFSQPCKPHFIGIWDTVAALIWNRSKQFSNRELNKDILNGFHAMALDEKRFVYNVNLWDETNKAKNHQTIEQVWFAGGHSDVGGHTSPKECALSDIALAWMLDKAEGCGLGLVENWKDTLQQDACGKMDNAWRPSWLIFGYPKDRKVPEGAILHQSVIDRMKRVENYKPPLPRNYTVTSTKSYKT